MALAPIPPQGIRQTCEKSSKQNVTSSQKFLRKLIRTTAVGQGHPKSEDHTHNLDMITKHLPRPWYSVSVRTRSDTTPVNSNQLLTRYVSPSFSFTLVLVPHFVCFPVVPPLDYAPLVGTLVPFRMFSLVSIVLRNSGLLLVVVYLGPAPDSSRVLAAYAVFVT